jgi:hypothetical protein
LLYQTGQTVQATWVIYDRMRADPVQIAFCRAMQLKTAAYLRFAVASCSKARDIPRALMKLGTLVQTLCTVTRSVDGKAAEAHVCKGTLDAQMLANFVDQISAEAELICTANQLPEAHKLRFVLEAGKMLYTVLKAARNSGEPFNTITTFLAGRLGDIISFVPLPSAIYALSHVSGTAAMATTMTAKRHTVTLLNPLTGRLQFEQFLSHFAQWNDNHFLLTSVRASEAVKQEWLHEQIASSTELVVAKQADATMVNPDAATMIAFLHRQRNHLHERQTLKKAARGAAGERVMRVVQRPQPDTSDEEITRPAAIGKPTQAKQEAALSPARFAAAIRAVWARPQLSKLAGNDNYKFVRVCAVCNKFDPTNVCEGGIECKMADNAEFTPLGRKDMRASRDVTGSGVGKDIFCFRCGIRGHFARECHMQTAEEKQARPGDPLVQLALADRDRKVVAPSTPGRSVPQMRKAGRELQSSKFVDRNRLVRARPRSRSPPRSPADRPMDFENGRWRELDLSPKNGSHGRARVSRG